MMRIPSGYVTSGDVLFIVLGSDNADAGEVRDAALLKLTAAPEQWSAGMPSPAPAAVKILDLSAEKGSNKPVAKTQPEESAAPQDPSPYPGASVEKARSGMSAFYAALGRATPPAPKADEPAKGTSPSASSFGNLSSKRKR